MNFQEFLKSKGWLRYYEDRSRNPYTKVYSDSSALSSYGPTEYMFEHKDYPTIKPWYGLSEKDKPPVLKFKNFVISNEGKTQEDYYRMLPRLFSNEQMYSYLLNGMDINYDAGKYNDPTNKD